MTWQIVLIIICLAFFIIAFKLRNDLKWKFLWKYSFAVIPGLVLLILNVGKNLDNEGKEKRAANDDEKIRKGTEQIKTTIEGAQGQADAIEAANLQKIKDAKGEVARVQGDVSNFDKRTENLSKKDEKNQIEELTKEINNGGNNG